ncbi:MAG TPA: response regulator transcription factor [Gemmatimonadaceae bacterium]|nr:response regulator transcription factor [Gemmatimonadaceae bacterium]
MTHVLVIEDNDDVAFGLRTALENEGFAVSIAADGAAGLAQAKEADVDLIILDLMLPKMDGYRVLRSLRSDGVDAPVLVLTAKGEEANKVQAFSIGGDDYVTKPFGVLELIARVKALLRRAKGKDAERIPAVERFGEIEVNPASRTVYRAGQLVSLTPREFDLLLALVRRRGAAASRADLLREVWEYQKEVVSRTVDIHIAELRRKLEADPAKPRHICTVWKVGYRLER